MRKIVKSLFGKFGLEVKRYSAKPDNDKVISLQPERYSFGNVLLSYIIEPFLLKEGEPVSNAHTHDWESLQIARTFLNLGYSVDVIDFRNTTFIPKKNYSFFVAARTNFQRIAQHLNEDCIKVVHLETSHWLFNNSALYQRCLDLQKRRGVTLETYTRKRVEPNWAIEHADYATIKGNDFTISTYSYARKPYFRTYNPASSTYPWPENKNFELCRNRFLWFGSAGMVHKGLDLTLEVFAGMPEYHLTVCGPVQQEKDFERIYYTELYQTPNIHTIGWVDISSQKFLEITNNCVGILYPSCAEGQAGAVVTCLQAALIPIISYESGVDVDGFGVVLKDCSFEEIRNTIRIVSAMHVRELELRARKAWEYARVYHTRERFKREYRAIIKTIMAYQGDEKEDKD
jgi:hypothetical protein